MKKLSKILFFCLLPLLFASCGSPSEPYTDDFNQTEWEKDVTIEINEIKFSEGTWWFRRQYVLIGDPIIETGEFKITYKGTEMDLQYTRIDQFTKGDTSKVKFYDEEDLERENNFSYKISSLDLKECDYTMPSGYAQKVQCYKNSSDTKFRTHTIEHALDHDSGELADIPSFGWFEKID
ncbi:MAG: hypothetical protein J5726_02795 [Treponema sp.]|nr:hypothetical protein [Treponema sp.]